MFTNSVDAVPSCTSSIRRDTALASIFHRVASASATVGPPQIAHYGGPRVLIAASLAVLVGIVQASFFEWLFHRYWLHRPWLPKGCFTAHTLVHHQLCKFDDTFVVKEEEQEEALHFQWWGGPLLVVLNAVPWALVNLALGSAGVALPYVAFVIGLMITIGLYYVGYEGLHYLMHKPIVPWITRSPYFRFIERHHRIHHVKMDRNLNVLLPLADLCLGTLVTTMPAPVPTPEAARRLARRHSKRGRTAREDVAAPDA